jgi:hypothetical protein
VLGAVFVELTWHRQHYRAAWKRGMWGALVVVTVAQAGIGFVYTVIDQWAHGAGLFGGALLAFALSPQARWRRVGLVAARVLAGAFVVLAAVAAVQVARTSVADSLGAGPYERREIGGVALTVPATWSSAGELSDREGLIFGSVQRLDHAYTAPELATWLASDVPAQARKHGFDRVATAAGEHVLVLPAGWEGGELVSSYEDPMGYRQTYRVVACARAFGDTTIVAVIYVPESILRSAPDLIARLIGSMGPA